jgi:lysine decarboxylase
MVGSLTQSAMLHVADTERVDAERLARMVRLMRSTSPNSLLLASLDAARRQIAIHGQDLLGRTVASANREVEAIDAIDGCRVVGADLVGRPGVAAHDPLRIVIDVRGTGCTGYEVSQALQRGSDVYVELATHATIVLVLGLGQPVGPLERFAHDLEAELDEIRKPGTASTLAQPETTLSTETAVPPREAFLRPGEVVAVDEAVGRVSAESIAGYPPGIPALLPGERITAEVVEYLRALAAAGARLHGASDPAFETVTILR